MNKTLVDFWHLIWQERPVSIVMVTNLKEGNKMKCEQYWPSAVSHDEYYGPFNVTLMNERIYPDSVIRNLSVTVSSCM